MKPNINLHKIKQLQLHTIHIMRPDFAFFYPNSTIFIQNLSLLLSLQLKKGYGADGSAKIEEIMVVAPL